MTGKEEPRAVPLILPSLSLSLSLVFLSNPSPSRARRSPPPLRASYGGHHRSRPQEGPMLLRGRLPSPAGYPGGGVGRECQGLRAPAGKRRGIHRRGTPPVLRVPGEVRQEGGGESGGEEAGEADQGAGGARGRGRRARRGAGPRGNGGGEDDHHVLMRGSLSLVQEVADVLLTQLELLRAQEKEMKRKKKKEEKAAMRAAAKQMKVCDESEDSEEEQEEMKRDNEMENKDPMKAAADQVRNCSGCKDSNHKEMKRRKKEEKAAVKSAGKQMKYSLESEDSSSSSSSESSDSDCEEEVVDMSNLRTIPADVETATGEVQMETPKGELNLPITVSKTEDRAKGASALQCDPECSSSIVSNVGSSTSTCCISSRSSSPSVVGAEAAVPMERIEVCMGGKCKKSGAMELMQEFESRVGVEGAVVGCKCMGKCREGPNVRVRNTYGEGDESVKAVRNPLCIGVGLDDVGMIVANFFAEKKDMGILTA